MIGSFKRLRNVKRDEARSLHSHFCELMAYSSNNVHGDILGEQTSSAVKESFKGLYG
jgi:hypothetical protein